MSTARSWEDAKEAVRSRIDFPSLVEDYVRLKKTGNRYMGLCPFHEEDTPSFSVSPDQGLFYCFGCGKGGDLFDFVQEIEHVDFPGALRELADRCGVELPEQGQDSSGGSDPRSRMYEINGHAAKRYRDCFWDEPGDPARRYMITQRGFSEEVLRDFDVGFAPGGWQNMVQRLKRDGFDLKTAVKAGLLGVSDEGSRIYDNFRRRILFPIRTLSGRVVGFGGRVLPESGDTPKYLNSPESPIFKKNRTLYGLAEARSGIRESGRCLVVEGYTDVLMCHQAGFDSAVATLGTALSEHHVRTLRRYADEVVLLFDGDEAGVRAARRGGRVALENGMRASVSLLPPGTDPADIIRDSSDSLETLLDQRIPYLEALLDWLSEQHPPDTTSGKLAILEEMVPLLRQLSSRLQQEEKVQWLADELRLSPDLLLERLSSSADAPEGDDFQRALKNRSGQTIAELLFQSLHHHPDQLEAVLDRLTVKDFSTERDRELMRALKSIQQSDAAYSPPAWMRQLPDDFGSELAALIVEAEGSEIARSLDPVRVADKMKVDAARREGQKLARELSDQDSGSPGSLDAAKRALLRQMQEMKVRETESMNHS